MDTYIYYYTLYLLLIIHKDTSCFGEKKFYLNFFLFHTMICFLVSKQIIYEKSLEIT